MQVQILTAALTMKNYTEFGWGLTHAPEDLTTELQEQIQASWDTIYEEPGK